MRITVFLGSNFGLDSAYRDAAESLGRAIADAGAGLVYGGASIGLMGVIADAALARGGEVIGVIPQDLSAREIMRTDLTELHVVNSMHERKALMAALADGFIGLPGGLGTLEEILEIWTWAQLGFHTKPCAILNVGGYFDGLIEFMNHATEQGFLSAQDRDLLRVGTGPAALVSWIASHAQTTTDVFRRGESSIL